MTNRFSVYRKINSALQLKISKYHNFDHLLIKTGTTDIPMSDNKTITADLYKMSSSQQKSLLLLHPEDINKAIHELLNLKIDKLITPFNHGISTVTTQVILYNNETITFGEKIAIPKDHFISSGSKDIIVLAIPFNNPLCTETAVSLISKHDALIAESTAPYVKNTQSIVVPCLVLIIQRDSLNQFKFINICRAIGYDQGPNEPFCLDSNTLRSIRFPYHHEVGPVIDIRLHEGLVSTGNSFTYWDKNTNIHPHEKHKINVDYNFISIGEASSYQITTPSSKDIGLRWVFGSRPTQTIGDLVVQLIKPFVELSYSLRLVSKVTDTQIGNSKSQSPPSGGGGGDGAPAVRSKTALDYAKEALLEQTKISTFNKVADTTVQIVANRFGINPMSIIEDENKRMVFTFASAYIIQQLIQTLEPDNLPVDANKIIIATQWMMDEAARKFTGNITNAALDIIEQYASEYIGVKEIVTLATTDDKSDNLTTFDDLLGQQMDSLLNISEFEKVLA